LLAELLGVGGAGFACSFCEPRGEGLLVVVCVLAGRVLRVVDFDGCRDVGAHRRDVLCPGRGHLEGSEESFARREVGAVEHCGHDVGVESAQVFGDEVEMGLARHGAGNWDLALSVTEFQS